MFEGITYIHWILATLGLALYYLRQIGNFDGQKWKDMFDRKQITVLISSIIFIPVLFFVCSEPGMNEIIPINYLTAVVAGYQTRDVMNLFFKFGQDKIKINMNNDLENSKTTDNDNLN